MSRIHVVTYLVECVKPEEWDKRAQELAAA
jgi:hypothetical protein